MPSSISPQPFPPLLSSFNALRTSFAAVVPGLGESDKLRIWSTDSSVLVAEWDVPRQVQGEAGASGRKVGATGLVWGQGTGTGEKKKEGEGERSPKKRRKSLTGNGPVGSSLDGHYEVVYLVSGNVLQVFIPTSPKAIGKVSLPFTPQATVHLPGHGLFLATSTSLVLFDVSKEVLIRQESQFSLPGSVTALTAIATATNIHVFIASTAIVSIRIPLTPGETSAVISQAYTAAIESAQDLLATVSLTGQVILLAAERESRIVTALALKADTLSPFASLPVPTIEPVHALSLGSEGQVFALSASGTAYGFDLDAAERDQAAATQAATAGPSSGKAKKRKVAPIPSLQPALTIRVNPASTPIVALAVSGGAAASKEDAMDVDGGSGGSIRVTVGLGKGVGRIVWEEASLFDAAGQLRSEVVIKSKAGKLTDVSNEGAVPTKRYKEDHAGKAAQQQALAEDTQVTREDIDLPVDGDLAEMTLADRLAVLNPAASTSERQSQREKDTAGTGDAPAHLSKQNAQSLSRMLLQALHTSDPQLLDMILTSPANSSPSIVRNTIRKLPAAMALPLLKACVERLGQGAGARKRGGGRGGGLNERQGSNVVAWIRGVLVERAAILMTVPSLPMQLSGLTHLLENRLQLQTPLLALSGRLDLALEQIELRKSILAARNEVQGGVYIEGESDSEVEIEQGEEEGIEEEIRFASRHEGEAMSSDDDQPGVKVNGYARNGPIRNAGLSSEEDDDEESEEESDADDGSDGAEQSGTGSEEEDDGDEA